MCYKAKFKKSQIFDDESIAMIWRKMQEDAQFENSQMIGCHVDCNKCGMKCRTMHNFKIRK